MAEKMIFDYGEKDAIGFQLFKSCFEYACRGHARGMLFALDPGKKSEGVYGFERSAVSGSFPGHVSSWPEKKRQKKTVTDDRFSPL